MLLLRGGRDGTTDDFIGESIDAEILAGLPYIAWLLDDAGPFGRARYAFVFRMKPTGVARPHIDGESAWIETVRIHIPITTNDESFLLSEGRSKHLAVGEAWTFDNQAMHAAVNGATVRTHLIMDVPRNPKLEALLANASWDPGTEDPHRWALSLLPDSPPIFTFAWDSPLSLAEKKTLGLDLEGFAARVNRVRRISRLMRWCPLREGDIIASVDGVIECPVARTALHYVHLRYKPGQTVCVGVIRDAQPKTVKLTLKKDVPLWVQGILNAIGRLSYTIESIWGRARVLARKSAA
jgi:Aspartyl/Asparaginyl beta-hydroxylase